MEQVVTGYSCWDCTEGERREGKGGISLSQRRRTIVGERSGESWPDDEKVGLRNSGIST